MKSGLSSIDISVLAGELSALLKDARIKNVYQIGDRELKIKLFSGRGGEELILAPNFFCVTNYMRPSPEKPTSFAMQMRKHLKGLSIAEVRQHNFDRIIEFLFKGGDNSYLLIAELFGSGNIILCSGDKKIIGLLEWQKWRHRRLGVGQVYAYPPEGVNALEADEQVFKETVKKSGKNIASTLAVDLNLGGLAGEEICLRSGVDKEKQSSTLTDQETTGIYLCIKDIVETVMDGRLQPQVIIDSGGTQVDALPIQFQLYSGYKSRGFESFNNAVDEFFSIKEITDVKSMIEEKFQERLDKLRRIEAKQESTIERFEEEVDNAKKTGDLIYQNMQDVKQILDTVNEARKKGYPWDEINRKLSGRRVNQLQIIEVRGDGSVCLEAEE